MPRIVETTEGSLELLLDTITNTFGGVLFIAILIAVLSQMRGKLSDIQNESIPQEDLLTLTGELSSAVAEIGSLQSLRAAQESLIESLLDDELRQKMGDLRTIVLQRDQMVRNRFETLDEITEKQIAVNGIAEALMQLDGDLEKARGQVVAARKALQTEIASRTRAARLPQMRVTGKIEVALVLRYGKLYFQHRDPTDPFRRALNTDEFTVIGEDAKFIRATPKPYRGTLVAKVNIDALKKRLARLDARKFYFAVAAWDDSFGEFSILRSVFVDLGFEYRLLPIPKGEAVIESHVENAKVQ